MYFIKTSGHLGFILLDLFYFSFIIYFYTGFTKVALLLVHLPPTSSGPPVQSKVNSSSINSTFTKLVNVQLLTLSTLYGLGGCVVLERIILITMMVTLQTTT